MDVHQCTRNLARVLFIVLTLFLCNLACKRDACALTINNGASYTSSLNVTLQLNLPPYTTQMAVSNEGGASTAFSPSSFIPWILSSGDGLKTVTATYTYSQPYSCTVPCGSYCCSTDRWGNCTGYCTQYCSSTCYNNGTSSESATITLDGRSVNTGATPVATATNPVTNKIYVANQGSNSVTVIDGATNATATVAAGMIPQAIAFNPSTNKVYVANSASNDVTVIDGATNTTETVAAGTSPRAIAVNPITNRIYVANEGSSSVTVINGATNEVLSTWGGLPGAPVAIAVNPVTNKIYIANQNSTVTVFDGATGMPYTVGVPGNPVAIAVNPVTNRIYVASQGSNTLTVIDGATNSPATFGITGIPIAIAVNPVTNRIYVANQGSNTLTAIDGLTNAPTYITVGTNPYAVALNQVSNRVYVANHDSNTITVVDGATNDTTTVPAGVNPCAVGINPVTNKAYVLNKGSGNVIAVDGAANTANKITVGATPRDIAVNMATNRIYVANADSSYVTVIDGATGTPAPVGIPGTPAAIAANPVTNRIYVAVQVGNAVSIIDGSNNTVMTIGTPGIPVAIAVNPVTNRIYVANQGSNTLAVIDGKTGTHTTPVGLPGVPGPVAVNPVTNKIYVINYSGNAVTVIDGATAATTSIPVGAAPKAISVNPATNRIYVANQDSNNVTVIDGVTNSTTTVAVGTAPRFIAVNPATNRVYVANSSSDNVSVINGATNAVTSIAAGTAPQFLAVNPATNKIYVTNQGSNNMTVIDGITGMTTTTATEGAPAAVAVNPVTGQIFVANSGSGSVSVITEQQVHANPLTTGIAPFAGNTVNTPTPSLSLSTNNGFVPNATGALAAYYQLDSWQGPWLTAETSPTLAPGLHTLYAFAADSQAATSTNTGSQSSPLTGTMTAYQFLVVPNEPPVITEGTSTSVNMSRNGTPSAFSLTLHASDANSDTLNWSVVAGASHGSATIGDSGTSVAVSYTPAAGYVGPDSFDCRVADGKGGSAYITVNVTVVQTYAVMFTSDGNGTLTGTTSQTVDSGASTSAVTAVPTSGYHFVNWTGSGGFVTTAANPLTVSNVTADQTITANFASDLVNGACGLSSGQSFVSAPSTNLCDAGMPTAVTGSGPWTWSCTGTNGGTTADCSAQITTAGVSNVLVAGGMSSNSSAPPTAEVFHQATGTWSSTLNTIAYGVIPTNGICNANMTLLGTGKALIAGGSCGGDNGTTTNATSLYDPATNLWSTGGPMSYGRNSFGLVTLANGDALAFGGCAGGCSGPNVLGQYFWSVGGTAERYSATNNSWTTKQSLNTRRAGLGGQNSKTVTLQNGKVLVCGGNDAFSTTYTSCELYDPVADSWTPTAGSYPEVGGPNGLILLDSGKVLAVLNNSPGAVLFDPAAGTWSATGAPLSMQNGAHLVKLGDGRVLMTGGYVNNAGTYDTLATAQIYAPTTGTWAATGSMGIGRYSHFAVLLGDGKVLAGGGVTGSTTTPWGPPVVSAEIFDPATGLWSPTGSMSQPRWNNVNAVRLPPPPDTAAPEVTFALPATASSTTVAITTLTATDNVAVTGYCLNETDSSSGCSWSGIAPSSYTFASAGIKTLYAFAKDAAGNISPSVSATVNIGKVLTITRAGSGTGTVTSSPAGIDCGATCTAAFPGETAVVLFQTPGSSSGFSGWGDACSGTGDCAFSMSADRGVTANFILSPMVKNQRTGVAYNLLQAACTEASGSDTIMALATLPAAALTLDAVKSLTIEGGYNTDYGVCSGLTPVFGPLTIKTLTRVSGLSIRPVPSSTKAITAFSFASPAAVGVVSEADHSIAVSVPAGTDVTALVPTITHTGASISPAPGTPRDFTNPVVYTVTAEDATTQAYTVTIQFLEPYVLPTQASDVSLGAKGVLVDGNRAYIVEGTLFKVLDVSNPLSPTLLGSVTHGFSDLRVEPHAIHNSIVWLIRSSSGGYGAATYVSGVDVSDPANPVVRGTLTLKTATSLLSNMSLIYSGYLLVHDYSDNLIYVIDINDPAAPALYSQWSVPNMVNAGPGNMMIDGTLLYLPCGENNTFRIYDLANLASVVQVGSVATGAQSYGTAVKLGVYVYMTTNSSMKVIDVTNPATPAIVGSVANTGYLRVRNSRLFSFDISGPTISAYSLVNPLSPVVEASSTVAVPAPSTSLGLYPLTSPAAAWVGNYLIGMTYGSAAQYNGARALNFPVN